MNNLFFKIIALLVVITLAGYFLRSLKSAPKISLLPAATPTTIPTSTLSTSDSIKNLFIKKYNWDIAKIKLSVKNDLGDYASGGVNNTDEIGGAMWFAAKVNGQWQLVFDGNGIIACSDLTNYPKFPTSLIPQCFDKDANKLVKR